MIKILTLDEFSTPKERERALEQVALNAAKRAANAITDASSGIRRAVWHYDDPEGGYWREYFNPAKELIDSIAALDGALQQIGELLERLNSSGLEGKALALHEAFGYGNFESVVERQICNNYAAYRKQALENRELPRTVALSIIKDAFEPGQPTLGLVFGWYQPDEESEVFLGSVYGTLDDFNVRDLLEAHGEDIPYDAKRALVKELRWNLDREDGEDVKFDGITTAEVRIPFSALKPHERVLYRFKTMIVNTMTEGHNWCIEWGEMLAQEYYGHKHAKHAYELYEENSWEDLASEIVDWELVELVGFTPHDYRHWPMLEGSKETAEWIGRSGPWPILIGQELVDEIRWSFEWDELSGVLSWFIDWLREEWSEGHLWTSVEDMPEDVRSTMEEVLS